MQLARSHGVHTPCHKSRSVELSTVETGIVVLLRARGTGNNQRAERGTVGVDAGPWYTLPIVFPTSATIPTSNAAGSVAVVLCVYLSHVEPPRRYGY